MSAISRRQLGALAVVLGLAPLALSACTSHGKQASQPPPSSSFTPVAAPAPSTPPPSSAAPEVVLPKGCTQLLPLGVVQQALGVGLIGGVTYLRAAAVPQSGRTGRVTCGYGTPMSTPAASGASPTPTGKPLVEVSYITYTDAKTAAGRVALTVQNDGASSTIHKVTVAGKPASVLTGKEWNELLMSDGARTIVVVVQPTVLTAEKAPAALTAMAEKMLSFGAAAPSSAPASAPASG
jgi:hypothetical protein